MTASYQVDPNWYVDTGATDHITNDLDRLTIREKYHGNDHVQVGNDTGLLIANVGHSSINTTARSLDLNNVLHVPQISKNLVSIHQLTRNNIVFFEFHPDYFVVKD